jgi:alpha-N-arabinofuranosidase
LPAAILIATKALLFPGQDARFAQFFDAIRAAYPKLKIIAIANVTSRTPDILDQHFYETPLSIERDAHHYDSFSRSGPLIMVGEYAAQAGTPTPNLDAAIGDAAWLTGLERNADLVVQNSYAPLFVNINQGASQWPTNMIGYDALRSYGSLSYYVHVLFSNNHGDTVLPATLTTTGDSRVFASVTRDSATGTVYVKVVNAADAPRPVHFTVSGVGSVASKGEVTTLTSASPQYNR